MMRETEQITVSIAGDSYTLVSDEGIALVEETARDLDVLMRQLANRTRNTDMRRVAVFAALKMALDLKRLQQASSLDQQQTLNLIKLISDELRTA